MFATSNSVYGSSYNQSRNYSHMSNHAPKMSSISNNSMIGGINGVGMSGSSYMSMKPHLNNRNIRRIEPESILKDYRNGLQNYYQNNTPAAVFPTTTRPCDGEEALKRVQERVQESLRKRGCLVGGSKVKMCVKPTVQPAQPIHPAQSSDDPNNQTNINTLNILKPAEPRPNIEHILPGSDPDSAAKIDSSSELAGRHSGIARRQVDPQGLRLASSAAKPPSLRSNACAQGSGLKQDTSEVQFVYKDLTVEEDKENNVNANNLSRYGHGETDKMNKRGLIEQFKRQPRNNKRVYDNPTEKTSACNPLQHAMRKGVPLTQKNSHYQTTNSSTYKRWQTSAFQTAASRTEDRPCWADPNVGGHFVRANTNHHLSKDKKIANTGNLGITLSVSGNNVYQGNRNKRNTNLLGQGGARKNAFRTEYQRTFDRSVLA